MVRVRVKAGVRVGVRVLVLVRVGFGLTFSELVSFRFDAQRYV
jgi:hypothetical protein